MNLSRLGVRHLYEIMFEKPLPDGDPDSTRTYLLISSHPQVAGADLGFRVCSYVCRYV